MRVEVESKMRTSQTKCLASFLFSLFSFLFSLFSRSANTASSIAAIAKALLEAVEFIARTGDGERVATTLQTVQNHPAYIALIWNMALLSVDHRDDLLDLRNYARQKTGHDRAITAEQFDLVFPLDSST